MKSVSNSSVNVARASSPASHCSFSLPALTSGNRPCNPQTSKSRYTVQTLLHEGYGY
jgi:hypothetical protein